MTDPIIVAGATGNLGHRIVDALIDRQVPVKVLSRPLSAEDRLAAMRAEGIEVAVVDYGNHSQLVDALRGARTVVSALQGLRPVIVDAQGALLDAAVEAGVEKFIPSDYAADLTKVEDSENRNFALRREFRRKLLAAPIRSTSILNGMFMDLLLYGMPLFDMKSHSVSYWGEPDQMVDLTTMDDTAAYTADAAIDPDTPEILRIAGDQISPQGLTEVGTAITGQPFELKRLGSIDDLAEAITKARHADPAGETEEFPRFQQMQYIHNMQSGRAKLTPIDNSRYPELPWTTVRDLMSSALKSR